ncbi:unnamed protein product [Soboliphyme baturini]|uniref:Uncharacterized protein n=1 Tax=Soboliphyme baturini TaxID=241478 RepID=A0A183J6V5_9BILA|nr:unnamed protein product [Soboliphyme baturini]
MVKTFVRGEVVNADKAVAQKKGSGKSRLYLPKPSVVKTESAFEAARKAAEEKAKKIMDEALKNRPQKPGKRKETKRLSNLEAFKEELKRAQEERAERRRLRQQLQDQLGMDKEPLDKIAPSLDNPYLGTYDLDPNTTNLFLSNLSPKVRVAPVY